MTRLFNECNDLFSIVDFWAGRSYPRLEMNNDGKSSKYAEDAAKWCLFDETVSKVRDAFRDMPTRELDAIIDESVSSVREKKRQGCEN